MPKLLVERLSRSRLVKWALAYLAGAWVVLQVLDLLAGNFAWSPLVVRAATVLVVAGFVACLVLAWFHGERGSQRVNVLELLLLAIVVGGAVGGTMVVAHHPGDGRGPAAAAPPARSAALGSIAVLPFANLSTDKQQEFFSDGLTEELLNDLTQLPELRVASRTSAFAYKNSKVSIDSIARALRVGHVLEGSVRTSGSRVCITAQLIRAEDGYHLWSQTYDRELKDVFGIQEEIARAVVQALQLRLDSSRGDERLAKEETRDPEAHVLELRGVRLVRQSKPDSVLQGIALFQKALERDPAYARVHADLARAYSFLAYWRTGPRADLVRKARESAARAVALDSGLAVAHCALADIAQMHDWAFATAEAHYRRAIELNPGLTYAHSYRAYLLSRLGRPQEAIAEARRASELDPISPILLNNLGLMYSYAGQPARAVESFEAGLALDSTNPVLLANAPISYSQLGRHADAIRLAERALALGPKEQYILANASYVYGRAGRRSDAERALRTLQALPEPSPYLAATAYAGLGDRERVFALLDRAAAEKDAAAPDLGADPVFNAYRTDPRMRRVLDRMGLP